MRIGEAVFVLGVNFIQTVQSLDLRILVFIAAQLANYRRTCLDPCLHDTCTHTFNVAKCRMPFELLAHVGL